MYRDQMEKDKHLLEKDANKILTSNNSKTIIESYNQAKQHLEKIYNLALRQEREKKNLRRCCFTGHRPEKLLISEKEAKDLLQKKIYNQIVWHGKREFITGMSRGVDIWAAEIVLEAKKEFFDASGDIKLIAALPYLGFEDKWDQEWKNRYSRVIREADYVIEISQKYCGGCYQRRNEWMVEHSSLVIALWNEKPSGTKNTIDYAIKQDVKVENCLDER